MEFGELVPLFFLFLCLLVATTLGGTIALVVIRFRVKDRRLAKNIVLAVAAVCAVWFLQPFLQLLYMAFMICRKCPESGFRVTWEVVRSTLEFSARSLICGLPFAYAVAFAIVTPITLAWRSRRNRRDHDLTSPSA